MEPQPFDLPEQIGDAYALFDVPRDGRVTIAYATIDRSDRWFLVSGHYWFPVFSVDTAYDSTGASRIVRLKRVEDGMAKAARKSVPAEYIQDLTAREWFVREETLEHCEDVSLRADVAGNAGRTFCNTCGRYQWLSRYERCPIAATTVLPPVTQATWMGRPVTELEKAELIAALDHLRQSLEAERSNLQATRRLLAAEPHESRG